MFNRIAKFLTPTYENELTPLRTAIISFILAPFTQSYILFFLCIIMMEYIIYCVAKVTSREHCFKFRYNIILSSLIGFYLYKVMNHMNKTTFLTLQVEEIDSKQLC